MVVVAPALPPSPVLMPTIPLVKTEKVPQIETGPDGKIRQARLGQASVKFLFYLDIFEN